ncbi:MAG: SH3 domain-containing protein, partial [Bacteroidota bacterium]
VLLGACGSDPATSTPPTEAPAEPVAPPPPIQNVALTITIDQLRLRDQPGQTGKELARLVEGSQVTEVGEVSDFSSPVQLRGVKYEEPWVKVKTAEGTVGWVYSAGLRYEDAAANALIRQLQQGRLRSFFGNDLASAINTYREQYGQIDDSEAFRTVFRQGRSLRDRMVEQLGRRVVGLDPEQYPDLSWLELALPGYVAQFVAEGTEPYLFNNFKAWKAKAQTTAEQADDEFIDICLQLHSTDSMEYFYPSWFLQTWDYGGHSLLGQNIHKSLMINMEAAAAKSPLFREEFIEIKDQLLEDICSESNTYWESQAKIDQEIQALLDANFSLMNNEDRVALSTRQQMFKDFQKNNIQLNLRSGEE